MDPPLSEEFKQPPLDGSLLISEIIFNHATANPTYSLFRYLEADGALKSIPWSLAVRGFHNAAQTVRKQVEGVDSAPKRPVVAILGTIDQITAFSLIAGVICAGYQVFPISPRNSEFAIVHLLQSTNCSHILVSPDATTQKLVQGAASAIPSLKLIPTPSFDELFGGPLTPDIPSLIKPASEDIAVILHSSGDGSVAFPKTIKLSYKSLMQSGLTPHYGGVDLCGQVWSAHAIPTFHMAGVMQLVWATLWGMTIAVFPPTSPPVVPTPERVFDDAVATHSTILYCVPSFLEVWAREPAYLTALKQFKSVIFAGGVLQPDIGDMLSQANVNIAHGYGLTETGGLNLFVGKSCAYKNCPLVPDGITENGAKESWNYFQFSPHIDPVFVPVADMPGVYRLIVRKCATHTPAILDTTVDGVPALDTNDLVVRHPDNEKLWKLYGRHDDQIMHSNGEKTNPAPLEAIMLKDPRIKYAVMFGRGKFNAGILIFPTEPRPAADTEGVIEFRREIWPAVHEANQFAPTHSRIFKEMIVVADPSKPIELTAKGTPRRKVVLETYRDEIQEAYVATEQSSQVHLTAPETYNAASSLSFVRSIVREVMREIPGDDEDLFQHGCDSLQATWIRNSILHALRTSQVEVRAIPHDFVYSHPTTRLLGNFLTQVASGLLSPVADISLRASAMEAMVLSYTREFPVHSGTIESPQSEAVLVTGTTGALGSYILADLLGRLEISIVYALNRPGASIEDRQRTSFRNNGIDVQLLSSPRLRLIEGDFMMPAFGLASAEYREMREKITCIIHNAWQVDFNISLSSLEPCISGTRNLVDFALSSVQVQPPRFIFVSTAGVFRNLTAPIALEQSIPDAKTSAGLGYGESKWVTEQMLESAGQKTALNPVVVRPGQLSGGVGGAWKTSEWFPTLLRASQLLGNLPVISGHISWVPIQHAAKILVEMRTSRSNYLHLTHPHPVPFSDVLLLVAEALKLPMVPYSRWVESLEAAGSQGSTNPGVRLLAFFRANGGGEVSAEDEAFFPAPLSNTNALEAASSMLSLASLGAQEANEWVEYLRKVGYLT
ncbi:hypothetical protein DFH09DRAFT_944969 [Mycena vulgaris]|nr:hypothetical protein DFH09DRAFT_944969 [Mycena vulgaris]